MIAEFDLIDEPFIVGETDACVAVFKPAGMHSIPSGKGGGRGDLLSWYAERMPETRKAFGSEVLADRSSELGMISRLDRGTSGIILFARKPALRDSFFDLAARGRIRKFYRLLATPSEKHLPGSIPGLIRPAPPLETASGMKAPAGPPGWTGIESFFRSYGEKGALVACVRPDRAEDCRRKLTKKTYTTWIRAESRISDEAKGAVVLSALIHSGFRHQIRAHLAWSGLPILGDRGYGGQEASRLFLEAYRIEVDQGSGLVPSIFELYGEDDEG
jgi:23S rRNA pseudouridine1911/1915/1917 synthase